MRRTIKWLSALMVVVLAVGLFWWFLPKSPVERALRNLSSHDRAQRREALRELKDALPQLPLTPSQRQKLAERLIALAEHDPDATVRFDALRLLPIAKVSAATMQRLALLALHRSAAEARWAMEVLPQVADATTWTRLMDAYERERNPVQRDRLLRLLRRLPPKHWEWLCERLGRQPPSNPQPSVSSPDLWQPVLAGLCEPSTPMRKRLVAWALSAQREKSKGALRLLQQFPPPPDDALRLAPLTKHPDKSVREMVFSIWAKAPSKKMLPQLQAALRDEPTIAFWASRALLKLGALRPEEGRVLVKRPDASLRAQGVLALTPSHDVRDWQLLTQALHDADLEVIRNAAAALAAKGEKGLSVVLTAYRTETRPERRSALLSGICGVAHPQVIAVLVEALKGGDWRERAVAMSGLAMLKDKALPAIQQLTKSPERKARLAAVDALNAIGTKEAMRLLLQMAREKGDRQVQAEALTVLSRRRIKEAVPLLTEALHAGDAELAAAAAFGLVYYGEQGRVILREALHSDSPITRQVAARALASVGDRAGVSELTKRLSPNLPEDQRIALLQALAKSGDQKALDELLALLGSDRPLTRLRARAALFGVGGLAVPALLRALESDDPKLRAEAAWLLGAWRIGSAREKLVRLTADPDPQVRTAAQRALARLDELPMP
ncbi:MAG: hypothetical protein SLRJCFUN_000397 [Candidatus Fervidibacter sp.]